MTLLRIVNSLSFFSLSDLFVYLLGKFFRSLRGRSYFELQEKKNKIDFLYLEGVRTLNCTVKLLNIDYNIRHSNFKISIRIQGSDAFVFKQILIDEEFKSILELFEQTFYHKPEIIVDAGSNIGCSVLYFLGFNPKCKILAIEPSHSNIDLAIHNITQNQYTNNVVFMKKALWTRKERFTISTDFRDGSYWSLTMIPNDAGEIESIMPVETFEYLQSPVIDLFKIDVEGGEAVLFGFNSDIGWLDFVKMVTIEIHEEFGSERIIVASLRERGFRVLRYGELTVGLNTKYSDAIHK